MAAMPPRCKPLSLVGRRRTLFHLHGARVSAAKAASRATRGPGWFRMQGMPPAKAASRATRGSGRLRMQGLLAAKAASGTRRGGAWFRMQGLPAAKAASRATWGGGWFRMQGLLPARAASRATWGPVWSRMQGLLPAQAAFEPVWTREIVQDARGTTHDPPQKAQAHNPRFPGAAGFPGDSAHHPRFSLRKAQCHKTRSEGSARAV